MLTIEERCHQWYCDMQTARSEEEGDAVVERHLREAIAEEREACAKAIEVLKRQMFSGTDWSPGPQAPARLKALNDAIAAIRARDATPSPLSGDPQDSA